MRAARWGLALVSVASLVGATATGCTADPQGGAGDAPIGTVEQQPWVIMNNVDGYPNVAFRCFRGNGIYTTRGDDPRQLEVVTADPACQTAPR